MTKLLKKKNKLERNKLPLYILVSTRVYWIPCEEGKYFQQIDMFVVLQGKAAIYNFIYINI